MKEKSTKNIIRPRFVNSQKSVFTQTLHTRVNDYFKTNNLSKHANWQMVVKTIILVTLYLGALACVCFFANTALSIMLLFLLMGLSMAGIGMSVMHDANHNAYSKSQRVNKWLGYSLNLVGGLVSNWKIQHNVLHHTYTNVYGHDDDIEDKAVLKFAPQSIKKNNVVTKYQYIHVFFFYCLTTLYWAVAKDFAQLRKYASTIKVKTKSLTRMWVKTISLKIFYMLLLIGFPIYFNSEFTGTILVGFLCMHFLAGLILTTIFQLAHSVEETIFPTPNENNIIENDWSIHQLQTTANFAHNNKLITWYVGGLNYQIEHHLFSSICHVHYPALSKIVKETANEFGIQYHNTVGFFDALKSHISFIKRIGRMTEFDLARM